MSQWDPVGFLAGRRSYAFAENRTTYGTYSTAPYAAANACGIAAQRDVSGGQRRTRQPNATNAAGMCVNVQSRRQPPLFSSSYQGDTPNPSGCGSTTLLCCTNATGRQGPRRITAACPSCAHQVAARAGTAVIHDAFTSTSISMPVPDRHIRCSFVISPSVGEVDRPTTKRAVMYIQVYDHLETVVQM